METNNLDRYKLNNTPQYAPKGSIEYAILEYLNEIAKKSKRGEYNSYKNLESLECMRVDEVGENKEAEDYLLNKLEKNHKILAEKASKDGKTTYIQIDKNLYTPKKINQRIYLNCERKNTAKLAMILIDNLEEMDQYYFKFIADESMNSKNRTNMFEFFIETPEQFNKIVEAIRLVKIENPELLEGAQNSNPFLQKIDGYISYLNMPLEVENAKSIEYKNLDGNVKKVDESFYELLANALEESFVKSIKKLAKEDLKITDQYEYYDLISEQDKVAEGFAQRLLPDVLKDDNKKIDLVEKMKKFLFKIQTNNDKIILPTEKNVNMKRKNDTDFER